MNHFKKQFARLSLLPAVALLGACGVVGNVTAGGPVVTGTVGTAAGAAVPAATDYRMTLVRYTTFGTGATGLGSAEFLTPFALSGGTGAFTGGLPASVEIGSGASRAYYRVVVYDDIVDDNRFDANATNGAGGKDRVLADSANGKAAGGDRYLVFASDNQDYVPGKPLVRGWNLIVDPNRDTNPTLGTGLGDDTVSATLTGVNVTY